ncbi:hypothetical protein EZJ19_07115 [Parasulfuritortus cantonensis]|uniref:Uncharacterized protein n=1 Tax=Parasulfuritortus cantonensis TaxID=2528202 RepID=A0A4R1BE51_9PROT|nr:hypothetical protein [Parasulfuritortus cantonensis]TCJ15379.1 hypothetical protein EZJ19_07115 [Parasulfuritortus cantonensis]
MIRIAFIAMAVISIAIAVAIVFSGRIKQHIVESLLKNNEDYISIEQAQDLSACAKLKGMTFKIPLNYMGQAYDRRAFGWRTIPRKMVKGCRPYDVDYIHIKALLPELSPICESNMGDFGVMGPGKKYPFH